MRELTGMELDAVAGANPYTAMEAVGGTLVGVGFATSEFGVGLVAVAVGGFLLGYGAAGDWNSK